MSRRYSQGVGRFVAAVGLVALSLAVADRGLAARAAESETSAWRYVVPEPGDPMEHPPLRELSLSDPKPPDLKETVHYRGSKQRYGEFRFGPAGSKLVSVVLDDVADGQTDVYVNVNRTRTIDETMRLAGPGPKYRVPLNVEIPEGDQTQRIARMVVFRLGRGGRSISYATAGYMEGVVRLEDRQVPVRRVDTNGDGGMADPRDLLWINWKADGKWNPFTDRLPMTPIIQVEKLRYAVRSDWAGQRLALEKLEGAGELQLSLPAGKKRTDFLTLDLVLLGREGSIAKLDLAQDKVTVPVGEYSLYELTVVMKDPAGGEPWTFSFGRSGDGADATRSRWYAVKADAHVPVDPLADLTLTAKLNKEDLQYHPGDDIAISPRLELAGQMTMRACYRSDKPDSSKRHPGAEIRLTTATGNTLSSVQSGFS